MTKAVAQVARKKAEVGTDESGNLLPGPLGLVSYPELSVLFRVEKITPHMWRQREQFVEPDDTVGGQPIWKVETVCRWGMQTGRPFYLTAAWVERLGLQS